MLRLERFFAEGLSVEIDYGTSADELSCAASVEYGVGAVDGGEGREVLRVEEVPLVREELGYGVVGGCVVSGVADRGCGEGIGGL